MKCHLVFILLFATGFWFGQQALAQGSSNAYCQWSAAPNATDYYCRVYKAKSVRDKNTWVPVTDRKHYQSPTASGCEFRADPDTTYVCEVEALNACAAQDIKKEIGTDRCTAPPPTATLTPTLTPAAKPNLAIGIQDLAPAQPVGGDDVSFRIKVWETNNVAVQNRFWYKLELTKIIGMYPQIIDRYEHYLDNVGANDVRIRQFDSEVFASLGDMEQGHYIISAYVDSSFTTDNTNLIDEANENDNEVHLDFYIGAAPTLTPTLTPTPNLTPAPETGTISGTVQILNPGGYILESAVVGVDRIPKRNPSGRDGISGLGEGWDKQQRATFEVTNWYDGTEVDCQNEGRVKIMAGTAYYDNDGNYHFAKMPSDADSIEIAACEPQDFTITIPAGAPPAPPMDTDLDGSGTTNTLDWDVLISGWQAGTYNAANASAFLRNWADQSQ